MSFLKKQIQTIVCVSVFHIQWFNTYSVMAEVDRGRCLMPPRVVCQILKREVVSDKLGDITPNFKHEK